MNNSDETTAWRKAYEEYCRDHIPSGVTNLQNVFTPHDLCYDIIRKLESYAGDLEGKRFCTFNLEFAEVLCYDFGVPMENVWFVTDCKEKVKFTKLERYNKVNTRLVPFGDFLKEKVDMKFSVVIGNPPYQAPSKNNNKGAGNTLWDKFVEKSFEISEINGFVVLIHPSGWRNIGGRFTEANKILTSKQIKYLEIHNADDGLKTFGAGTRYDWYIATNSAPRQETLIVGEDNLKYKVDFSKKSFIPNGMVEGIAKLFATDPKDRVKFLYNCSYHSSSGPVSKEKKSKFIYPCIQHVSTKDNMPSCIYYSNTKNQGHFGIPKIIFGVQISGVMIDTEGKYGMCEHCAAIVDKPKNLELIQRAMLSEKFIELMKMCDVGGNRDRYNWRVFKYFRHDFWREFI